MKKKPRSPGGRLFASAPHHSRAVALPRESAEHVRSCRQRGRLLVFPRLARVSLDRISYSAPSGIFIVCLLGVLFSAEIPLLLFSSASYCALIFDSAYFLCCERGAVLIGFPEWIIGAEGCNGKR